jgi:hypothetical protein
MLIPGLKKGNLRFKKYFKFFFPTHIFEKFCCKLHQLGYILNTAVLIKGYQSEIRP